MSRCKATVTFWGTRGSIPVPGLVTSTFGGNTSCVEIRYGSSILILDAGTGIRPLGEKLKKRAGRLVGILVTHPHLDHIGGLPFFAPALEKGKILKIFGPPNLRKRLHSLFPFSILPSKKIIREIETRRLRLLPFLIETRWVNHPGGALAYKIVTPQKHTIVYISDHEPLDQYQHFARSITQSQLKKWIGQTDLLIMDAQYFDHEYPAKKGWGHSTVSQTVRLALEAHVKKLVLYHHNPSHHDGLLPRKLKIAEMLIKKAKGSLVVKLAKEGESLRIL